MYLPLLSSVLFFFVGMGCMLYTVFCNISVVHELLAIRRRIGPGSKVISFKEKLDHFKFMAIMTFVSVAYIVCSTPYLVSWGQGFYCVIFSRTSLTYSWRMFLVIKIMKVAFWVYLRGLFGNFSGNTNISLIKWWILVKIGKNDKKTPKN